MTATSGTSGGRCARSTMAMSDVIDAHAAPLTHDGDLVLTTDPDDIRALLQATGTQGRTVSCRDNACLHSINVGAPRRDRHGDA